MAAAPISMDAAPVDHIFLSLINPRHSPLDTEAQAIDYLCRKESVYPLARDVAKHGLNPLERFALVPVPGRKNTSSPRYFVAEGNRRLCALKLLNDAELAPAGQRRAFQSISAEWQPIRSVSAVLFPDLLSVKLWLDRIHNGEQGGVGRRSWDAEQKARSDGGNKNKLAQALLDYAEGERMITSEERRGKITTVQRFLVNDVFRETIGIDQTDPDGLRRNRPKDQFDLILRKFVRDLVENEHVTSRMNKKDIIAYARPLGSMPGVGTDRVEGEAVSEVNAESGIKSKTQRPKAPLKPKHIQFQAKIASVLDRLGNGKLQSLYHSICNIELEKHTPLLSVGTWSLFETLTACAGRNSSTDFQSFLSKSKLGKYAITDTVSLTAAIGRIREYGNSTKHHPVSAAFNGEQLNNDMIALTSVIIKCIEEAITQKG